MKIDIQENYNKEQEWRRRKKKKSEKKSKLHVVK